LPLHVLGLRVLADRRRGHAVAHRIEPEWHRSTRALQDAVGDSLQTARHPEPAEAFGEMHPRQAGVITGAEILLGRYLFGSWSATTPRASSATPFGISVIANSSHDRNSTPVEKQRPPVAADRLRSGRAVSSLRDGDQADDHVGLHARLLANDRL
jgi:hypothetical protein